MSVGISGAIIGAGALGAGGSIASGLIGKGAASDAASAQLQGTRESIQAQKDAATRSEALLREFNNTARSDIAPFRDAQLNATQSLAGLTDPNNPYYQQQRQVNVEAIQRQLAAQGLLRSKSQTDLLSNLELGLNQQRVGILGGLAGNGAAQQLMGLDQNLGANLAGIQGNLGQQIGSSFQQQSQIMGQNSMAQGQALSGTLAGIGNALSGTLGGLGNLNQQAKNQQFIMSLLGGGGGGAVNGGLTAFRSLGGG